MIDLEYTAISKFYGDKVTKRSNVRLMDHIDVGLQILNIIDASIIAKKAFCLHPIFQADADLLNINKKLLFSTDPEVILTVMEYRNQANSWLSDRVQLGEWGIKLDGYPTPGPLSDVRDMLIADKVQNYKDFLKYHSTTHPRRSELRQYFNVWLNVLQVDYIEILKKAELEA